MVEAYIQLKKSRLQMMLLAGPNFWEVLPHLLAHSNHEIHAALSVAPWEVWELGVLAALEGWPSIILLFQVVQRELVLD